MSRRLRSFLGSALLVLAGCGGSDSTGPTPPANVGGTWRFNWTNMAGTVGNLGSISCQATGVNATLSQSGVTFTGTIIGEYLVACTAGGQTASDVVSGGVITNGIVNGNQVSFNLATADASQTGTVSGNSMSGSATWRLDLGSPYGVVTLRGSWGGSRR
jgi:myosin-crossreactive antigen